MAKNDRQRPPQHASDFAKARQRPEAPHNAGRRRRRERLETGYTNVNLKYGAALVKQAKHPCVQGAKNTLSSNPACTTPPVDHAKCIEAVADVCAAGGVTAASDPDIFAAVAHVYSEETEHRITQTKFVSAITPARRRLKYAVVKKAYGTHGGHACVQDAEKILRSRSPCTAIPVKNAKCLKAIADVCAATTKHSTDPAILDAVAHAYFTETNHRIARTKIAVAFTAGRARLKKTKKKKKAKKKGGH